MYIMFLKQTDTEYFTTNYKDIYWVNPSSFKHKDIITPYDWWYKLNNPSPDTRAKLTGTMQHEYFLEKGKFNQKYVFLRTSDFPLDCKKTQSGYPDMRNLQNVSKKNQVQFDNPNKEIILPEDTDLFFNVKNAFEKLRDINYLLDSKNGYFEHSFYAFALFDSVGNFDKFVKMDIEQYLNLSEIERNLLLPVKCRMDYLSKIKTYIIELKVTKSIRKLGFQREIEEYGYHIQGAFYLDIATCIFEKEYNTFIFLVAENKPPFHSIKYIADERMIQSGREEYKWKLEMIYKAIRENYYPGLELYSDVVSYDEDGRIIENRQMISIDLPDSYYYRKYKLLNI